MRGAEPLRFACFVGFIAFAPALPHLPHSPYPPSSPYPLYSPSWAPGAQAPDALARQVDERMRTLQREAERLATESRTLVGEVRKLEIERDIRVEQAKRAEADFVTAKQDLERTTNRIAALEQRRVAALPDLKSQLVDIYKRGQSRYLRMLIGAKDLREFARANRAVAAAAARQERLIAEHGRTLEALRAERKALDLMTRDLHARDAAARQARALVERAVGARGALMEWIDSRRDLTAQYIGELQVAHERIERQVAAVVAGRAAQPVTIPIAPFRGALEWPVSGTLTGRFGQPSGRVGGTLVRSGIEIAAPEGAPVRAIHAGIVGFAEGFTGLGVVVILDHGGNNSSVYGYLSSSSVQRGDTVVAGAEVGRVGSSPTGPPSLYFEVVIDGRFVNPVQWLKSR